jgi:hypothetical protein
MRLWRLEENAGAAIGTIRIFTNGINITSLKRFSFDLTYHRFAGLSMPMLKM